MKGQKVSWGRGSLAPVEPPLIGIAQPLGAQPFEASIAQLQLILNFNPTRLHNHFVAVT